MAKSTQQDAVIRVKAAELELIKLDPKLGALIELQKPIIHQPRSDYFFALCRAIVSQQLSTSSAAAIFGRLEKLTDLKPDLVASLSDEQTKAIGLSRQKTAYLRDLALHFGENPKIYNHLEGLSDEQVITELTAVKGIGVWTAQMFLMFTMMRLDVFAPDDIGIQRAMKQLYGWDKLPDRQELEAIADKWRPYRTVACWHLWQSLHNTPA